MRRIGWISFAALVALGLLWSAAATSKLVPIAQRGNQLGLDAVRQASCLGPKPCTGCPVACGAGFARTLTDEAANLR